MFISFKGLISFFSQSDFFYEIRTKIKHNSEVVHENLTHDRDKNTYSGKELGELIMGVRARGPGLNYKKHLKLMRSEFSNRHTYPVMVFSSVQKDNVRDLFSDTDTMSKVNY